MKKNSTIQFILFIVIFAVNDSCYITKERRMNSWMGQSINDLILQNGYPEKIFYDTIISTGDSTYHEPIIVLVYHNKMVKKYKDHEAAANSTHLLDSFSSTIKDTGLTRQIYGQRDYGLSSNWRCFTFGFNKEGEIIETSYKGIW